MAHTEPHQRALVQDEAPQSGLGTSASDFWAKGFWGLAGVTFMNSSYASPAPPVSPLGFRV